MNARKNVWQLIASSLPVLPFFLLNSSGATASEPVIITPENAASFGIDFEKAENVLHKAGIYLARPEIGIRFHEEVSTVDLSGLDGFSITVNADAVREGTTNEERGGA